MIISNFKQELILSKSFLANEQENELRLYIKEQDRILCEKS
ncbi:hypothetical protein pb186bvf_013998 [Paramecium bursaria]